MQRRFLVRAPAPAGGERLIGLDTNRIFHAEPEIRVAMHQAAVHLGDTPGVVDADFIDCVSVRQTHFVASGQTIRGRNQSGPEVGRNNRNLH